MLEVAGSTVAAARAALRRMVRRDLVCMIAVDTKVRLFVWLRDKSAALRVSGMSLI